jgi:pimeloyl-ACP methyl ester carboxylesterase
MAPDGFPLPGQQLGQRPYDVGIVADLIKFFMPKFLVKKTLEPAFFDASQIDESLLERYHDLLRAPNVRESILQRMRQTVNSDPRARLRKISAPTLLLWGERDRMIPSENSADYEAALQHSKTVILPRAGHLLQEENPQVALQEVLSFMEVELR